MASRGGALRLAVRGVFVALGVALATNVLWTGQEPDSTIAPTTRNEAMAWVAASMLVGAIAYVGFARTWAETLVEGPVLVALVAGAFSAAAPSSSSTASLGPLAVGWVGVVVMVVVGRLGARLGGWFLRRRRPELAGG